MKTLGSVLLPLVVCIASAQPVTTLWERGYSVIPTPRTVHLDNEDFAVDANWSIAAGSIAGSHIAVRSLIGDLREFHGLTLSTRQSSPAIRLAVKPGTVATNAEPEIDRQAYRLTLDPTAIEITGNSDAGLFYGVQTLLQLLRQDDHGRLTLPKGRIEDWPTLQLRFLHWDTKHHQDRMETLKRYLDWSARMKINMIGFELEDKFEYPSNPAIGAPGAFTTAQLQEIVNYGLERFIQVVPNVQSPGHMAYVLKHPQFAELRADRNNFLSDVCDPRTYDLIFSMYDDVIKATKGVDYFFASTDEVYYVGVGGKCKEPYNPTNRSLKWAEFARKAHDFLASRHRRMLAWVEYPLLPEHIKLLPPGIIDGVIGEEAYIPTENAMGMRQLAYTYLQGEEKLFPNNLSLDLKGGSPRGHLRDIYETISFGRIWKAHPIGVFGAAWGDSGLHNETFWLGWSTVAQYGWSRGTPSVEQHTAEFMRLYYGPNVTGMVDVYREMQRQARFWEQSWDKVRSRVRGLAYAHWDGTKGIGDAIRWDFTLSPPPLPAPDLKYQPAFATRYRARIEEARRQTAASDQLIHALQENFAKAGRNRYNLEVFLALARFIRHQWDLLPALQEAETALSRAGTEKDPKASLAAMMAAHKNVSRIQKEGEEVFQQLVAVFEKSRFPKGQSVGGRQFVHIMDDTKDHWADRTADLGYMMAPERSIGLGQWLKNLEQTIRTFAKEKQLPVEGL